MADDQTEFIRSTMPFCALLAIRCPVYGSAEVRLELDWRDDLCTIGGLLHGGVLMALADSAGAAAAFTNLPDGATGTTTIESKTNFVGAVRSGATIVATARPLHVGRTTIVVETELRDLSGRLVAKTTQTQAVLRAA